MIYKQGQNYKILESDFSTLTEILGVLNCIIKLKVNIGISRNIGSFLY